GRKAPSEGNEGKEGTAAPPASTVGTSYLVFVDDSFSVVQDRNTVLQRLAADLSLLGPEDRMAVVAFDGRKLVPLSAWSGDRAALPAALSRAAGMPSLVLRARDERPPFPPHPTPPTHP